MQVGTETKDFEIFVRYMFCGDSVAAELSTEFMGGVAFKKAPSGAIGGTVDGASFGLSANGVTASQSESAVVDLGAPVWEDSGHIFTRLPRSVAGSRSWPGIQSATPADGRIRFETSVGGTLLILADAARGSASVPAYLTATGTRWMRHEEPVEISEIDAAGSAQPVNLTVWSRAVSPGFSEELAASPGFDFFVVVFRPNTETEFVYTEEDAGVIGDPESSLPGDAVYFPAAMGEGSCGGEFRLRAIGLGTLFAWSSDAAVGDSLLSLGWSAVSGRAVPLAGAEAVYARPTPGGEEVSLPGSAGATASFAFIRAIAFVDPPFALDRGGAPYSSPYVLATAMRIWADRPHLFDAVPGELDRAA